MGTGNKKQSRWLMAIFVLAFAAPMLAGPMVGKTTKTNLTFSRALKIGDKQLKPGDYSVVANGTKVSIMHSGKLMAEAPAQWVDSDQVATADSVVYENQEIREFRFKGLKQRLVIQPSTVQQGN
jgi:hypothetical protein